MELHRIEQMLDREIVALPVNPLHLVVCRLLLWVVRRNNRAKTDFHFIAQVVCGLLCV